MATAQQYKLSPSDRDDPAAAAAASRQSPGNDNAETQAAEAEVRSKQRTWQIFVRMLLLGGLLAGLATAAVVLYIYS